ncbi:hypothetical protein HPP92_000361 [Vanilla planifolia]|uniref:Uncharacterized protein n=1 Tax=Vanilla planifolia TaxID=51239 RepID=A0A835S1Z5_VANPL|nr:hypothetical protein HPP92_000368 [Vanilla planifolia]KAG0500289.1 hypothetical protein HPP92_000361 [Vanilla planifolia]
MLALRSKFQINISLPLCLLWFQPSDISGPVLPHLTSRLQFVELKGAQVKTLSFLTYLLDRTFADHIRTSSSRGRFAQAMMPNSAGFSNRLTSFKGIRLTSFIVMLTDFIDLLLRLWLGLVKPALRDAKTIGLIAFFAEIVHYV